MGLEIACISSTSNDLGESLYWDVDGKRLYWIDAWKTKVFSFEPITNETCSVDLTSALAGLPIGSVARRDAGGMPPADR